EWSSPRGVDVDPEQFVQVLTNLLQNAMDAVENVADPRVTITTKAAGKHWLLEAEDNGPAFSREAQGQLFVPYFTTKSKGTGLGLAIVHQNATGPQATVEVGASALGGARVTVTFPLCTSESGKAVI